MERARAPDYLPDGRADGLRRGKLRDPAPSSVPLREGVKAVNAHTCSLARCSLLRSASAPPGTDFHPLCLRDFHPFFSTCGEKEQPGCSIESNVL